MHLDHSCNKYCISRYLYVIEPLQDFHRTPTTLYPWAITVFYSIPALSNSDHLGLMANLSFKSTCRNPQGRVVWRYTHADWERACNLIHATDWFALLDSTDINLSWTNWSKAFLSIMDKCIPKATPTEEEQTCRQCEGEICTTSFFVA